MGSTVFLFCPLTEAGRQWVEQEVHFEPHQQMGTGVVIGARYITPIVEGAKAAGLALNEDFEVISG